MCWRKRNPGRGNLSNKRRACLSRDAWSPVKHPKTDIMVVTRYTANRRSPCCGGDATTSKSWICNVEGHLWCENGNELFTELRKPLLFIKVALKIWDECELSLAEPLRATEQGRNRSDNRLTYRIRLNPKITLRKFEKSLAETAVPVPGSH